VNTSKYLEIFACEAEEHLQLLRQGLLELEKGGYVAERVHELLRSAHTLKGSARMLDLEQLGAVAHALEDLLKEMEEGSRALSPDLIDLLLIAVDALEALVAQAHAGGGIEVNVETVLSALQAGVMPERTVLATRTPAKVESDSVRTSVAKLDHLVNLLGETLIASRMFEERGRQLQGLMGQLDLFHSRLRKAENYLFLKEILKGFSDFSTKLERDTLNLAYLTGELHSDAMELRMLPLATITEDLAHMTRSLARDQGKEINLIIRGDEVELDRMMLEATRPMLLHMLRNAVDHGIEAPEERQRAGKPRAGEIELSARYEGGVVKLVLHDDGRGIDPKRVRKVAVDKFLVAEDEARNMSDEEAVYLILRPGFSTREFITDVSGRGVGMDVVKSNLDRVKGNLVIHSKQGAGTEIVLQLPLTLALISGLVIDCEGETYAFPLHYVAEILRLSEKEILTEGGREVVRVRGTTLPLVSLREILGLPRLPRIGGGRVTALVLRFQEQQLACLITRSLEVQELVVKGMGRQLKSVEFFSGATILADGSPALILSVPDLFGAHQGRGAELRKEFAEARAKARRGRVLVVDDSITTRTMEKNILETHGYDVMVAVSGTDALSKLAVSDFDLVVSDVEMPGMTGFELTRRIRQMEHTRELPVIIVTSLSSNEDRRKGIEVGAQAYIVKGSFDQGTLLSTVETLIG
jgi:two-component system, chemotaxis family, sensor kinase CheA